MFVHLSIPHSVNSSYVDFFALPIYNPRQHPASIAVFISCSALPICTRTFLNIIALVPSYHPLLIDIIYIAVCLRSYTHFRSIYLFLSVSQPLHFRLLHSFLRELLVQKKRVVVKMYVYCAHVLHGRQNRSKRYHLYPRRVGPNYLFVNSNELGTPHRLTLPGFIGSGAIYPRAN